MANTAPLSPDELKKRIEEEKSLSGILGRSPQAEAAKIEALTKASQGQGLPSAPPADVTKAARPLTGGDSTPPPAENGFTPPAVAAETKAANLPSYIRPSEDLTKRLTPSDTSLIPNGAPGTRSNMSAVGQDGQVIKVDMSQAQARNEGAQVVPGLEPSTRGAYIDPNKAEQLKKGMTRQADATGEFLSGVVEGAKKAYAQLTAPPDYSAFNKLQEKKNKANR